MNRPPNKIETAPKSFSPPKKKKPLVVFALLAKTTGSIDQNAFYLAIKIVVNKNHNKKKIIKQELELNFWLFIFFFIKLNEF